MPNLFDSPKRTLERAKHHIADLERQIETLVHDDSRAYVIEKDADGVTNIHKIRFTRWLPDDASSILFDIATNLRAVLDQTAYAAALASGKTSPKNTLFPFAATEDQINSRGKSNDVPTEILSLFCTFKPYKGGNNTLWALNRLCNAKKHCALVPISTGFKRISFAASSETGMGGLDQNFPTRWDPAKNEIILMRAAPEVRLTGNVALTFSVAIKSVDV